MTEATGRAYTVRGMSCEHCRDSVIEEVWEVEGVEGVEVDLSSGRVEVRGKCVSDEAVRAAVEDAGYEVVGATA